jgi:hypothetical protein
VATELAEEKLDQLISQLRERVLILREEQSLDQAAQMKLISHSSADVSSRAS